MNLLIHITKTVIRFDVRWHSLWSLELVLLHKDGFHIDILDIDIDIGIGIDINIGILQHLFIQVTSCHSLGNTTQLSHTLFKSSLLLHRMIIILSRSDIDIFFLLESLFHVKIFPTAGDLGLLVSKYYNFQILVQVLRCMLNSSKNFFYETFSSLPILVLLIFQQHMCTILSLIVCQQPALLFLIAFSSSSALDR